MGPNETRNLWLSIAAGLFAIFLVYSYSQEKKAELDKKYGSMKQIVVAKEDINETSTIYDNVLETKLVPNEYMVPDSINAPEEAIGLITAVPLKKGQTIVKNMLLTPGPDTGLSLQVAPTNRAVTIPVDDVRGVAKLIRPGDRVDIFAAVDVGKGSAQHREVTLLLQDVSVLSTGVSIINNIPRTLELDSTGKNVTQTALTGDSKYSTITVEADLKQSQDLVYILSTSPGNIYFVLRNPNDRKKVGRLPASTAESLLDKPTVDFSAAPSGPVVPNTGFSVQPAQPPPPQKPQQKPNGFRNM